MNTLIQLLSTLFWGAYILLISLIALTSLSSQPSQFLPYRSYIVQTGSMEPTIMTGDVIFIRAQTGYQAPDIVTFTDSAGHTITHRILEESNSSGTRLFTTKGDNNKTKDPEPITANQIIGKYLFHVPRMGYLVINLQRPIGTALLVGFPLIMIIASELLKEKQQKHDAKP